MKPTIVAAIKKIDGGRLNDQQRDLIAEEAIKIVEAKHKEYALKALDTIQQTARDGNGTG